MSVLGSELHAEQLGGRKKRRNRTKDSRKRKGGALAHYGTPLSLLAGLQLLKRRKNRTAKRRVSSKRKSVRRRRR